MNDESTNEKGAVTTLETEAAKQPSAEELLAQKLAEQKAQQKADRLKRYDELIAGGEGLLGFFKAMFEAAREAAKVRTPKHYADMAGGDWRTLTGRIAELKQDIADWKQQRGEVEAAE